MGADGPNQSDDPAMNTQGGSGVSLFRVLAEAGGFREGMPVVLMPLYHKAMTCQSGSIEASFLTDDQNLLSFSLRPTD